MLSPNPRRSARAAESCPPSDGASIGPVAHLSLRRRIACRSPTGSRLTPALHAGTRVLQRAAAAGVLHAWRQRLDRLRPPVERQLQLDRAAAVRAGAHVQHGSLVRPEDNAGRSAVDAEVPWFLQHGSRLARPVLPDALRREPALDVPQGRVCDGRSPGNVQQPLHERLWCPGRRRRSPGVRRLAPPLVDPQSRDVFAFQAQIVPANRTAVPAP